MSGVSVKMGKIAPRFRFAILAKLKLFNYSLKITNTMIVRTAGNNSLLLWISRAQVSNIAYWKIRKDLLAAFARIISLKSEESLVDSDIVIDNSLYDQIWQFLSTRNDKLNDNVELAFREAINELLAKLESPGDSDTAETA